MNHAKLATGVDIDEAGRATAAWRTPGEGTTATGLLPMDADANVFGWRIARGPCPPICAPSSRRNLHLPAWDPVGALA